MDAETWNRYRLRCAKLSEVVARSERSLATVRMTEKDWMRRFGTGTGFAGAKLSEVLSRSERSLATVRMTEKDLEPVPASLSRSCPRSFRVASVRSLRSG